MMSEEITEEEILILTDGEHDKQPGVYNYYRNRSHWLSVRIKAYFKGGYELDKRLPEDGITIFRKIKERLDKQKVEKVIDKILSCSSKNLPDGKHCDDKECQNCCKNKELKKELGLE